MMKTLKYATAFVAMGMAAAVANTAHALIIDDFTNVPFQRATASGDGPTYVYNSQVTPAAIGGERDIELWIDLGRSISPEDAKVRAGLVVANGQSYLSFSADTGTQAGARITYDGIDNSPVNAKALGGVDLTAGGNNSFSVGVIQSDFSARLWVTVYDGANSATWSLLTPSNKIFDYNTPTILTIFYAAPTSHIGTVDFTSVDAVSLEIETISESTDLALRFFRTSIATPPPTPTVETPEPASMMALVAAGLGGLILRRRRSLRAA